jgi:hypothetical protein
MEAFMYISCDVPDGVELREWRRTLPHKQSAWRRLRRTVRISRFV